MSLPSDDPESHRIRLRGPCLLGVRSGESVADDDTQMKPVKVRIPTQIRAENLPTAELYDGHEVFLHRKFNKPSGISAIQQVMLEFRGFTNVKRFLLNETQLVRFSAWAATTQTQRFDISEILQSHNRIEITYGSLPAEAGEIELVIRSASV